MGGDVEGFGGKRSHSAFSGMRFFPDEAFLIPHTCVRWLTLVEIPWGLEDFDCFLCTGRTSCPVVR